MVQRKGNTRMSDGELEDKGIPSLKGYAGSRSGSDIEPDNAESKGMAEGSDKRFIESQAGRSNPDERKGSGHRWQFCLRRFNPEQRKSLGRVNVDHYHILKPIRVNWLFYYLIKRLA